VESAAMGQGLKGQAKQSINQSINQSESISVNVAHYVREQRHTGDRCAPCVVLLTSRSIKKSHLVQGCSGFDMYKIKHITNDFLSVATALLSDQLIGSEKAN
jgi:hypothetical protein